jgi:hypothetical protein
MNHDITHCDAEITPGELCTRRLKCFRYIAHLDLIEHPIPRRAYISAYDCVYETDTSEAWNMYETL